MLQADGLPDARAGSVRLRSWMDRTQLTPTFATVHQFSMHTLQLRLWLRAGGIDPDREVRIIVLPPEQMADNLGRGVIDGYCVGEPWSTMAVLQGTGAITATGYQLWNNAPEKVLAVTARWHQHYPGAHLRLRLALMQACARLADPGVRRDMAAVLAQRRYLDMPLQVLQPSLGGELRFVRRQQEPVPMRDFHVFSRYQAGFPWRSTAALMVKQCSFALGQSIDEEACVNLAQQCYRPDLYREAARCLGLPCPAQEVRAENQHAQPWELEPGIELGPDLQLLPD